MLPADFSAMAPARAWLAAWLGGLDAMTPALSHRIVLGTGEALTNAIEHGSGGDPERAVTIEAFADSGEITVTVSDSGNWTRDTADTADAARAGGRGRGLRLIRGLASGVQTVSGPRGTRVAMTYRVPSDRREQVRRSRSR